MGRWIQSLTQLRPLVLISLTAFLLLSTPPQMLELYAIDASNFAKSWKHFPQFSDGLAAAGVFGSSLFGSLFLLLMMWICAIYLLALDGSRTTVETSETILVVAVAITPVLGIIAGLHAASSKAEDLHQVDLALALSRGP